MMSPNTTTPLSSPLSVDIFTIFPDEVDTMSRLSILGRAQRDGLLVMHGRDLRMAATDPHRSVDDTPFGGGAGMILSPEPTFAAVRRVDPPRPLFLLDPGGRRFDQATAAELAAGTGFSLLCGRYEGVDDRIRTVLCDGELSIGDVVLAGGEYAAMVIVEAVARLLPGALGNEMSPLHESFTDGLLEYPQWTRPATFEGSEVPEILRSGDHARIERWRRAKAIERTATMRPDLLADHRLDAQDRKLLDEFGINLSV